MPLTGFTSYPLQRILAPARIAPFGADAVTPWPPSGQGTVGSTPTRSTRLATGDQRARTRPHEVF